MLARGTRACMCVPGVSAGRRVQDDPEPSSDYPGSELLRGPSAEDIAERLVDGDPLGLLRRACAVLMARAYYVDARLLVSDLVDTVAERALTYRGEPTLDEWLNQCALDAAETLVEEQRREHATGWPAEESPSADLYRMAAGVLKQPENLENGRLVCILLNRLPDDERIAFSDNSRGVAADLTAAKLGVSEAEVPIILARAARAIEGRAALGSDPRP